MNQDRPNQTLLGRVVGDQLSDFRSRQAKLLEKIAIAEKRGLLTPEKANYYRKEIGYATN